MYFVNWQKDVTVEELQGRKVVIKRNKPTKIFHEYLLLATYTLVSILLGHPSSPPILGYKTVENEGQDMRNYLSKIGIRTPLLISLSDSLLIEEYIEHGDLYRAFSNRKKHDLFSLAFQAGTLTGKLHNAGYAFIDNKSQNYLVARDNSLLRIDLAFIQRKNSVFPQSMDIGSFLASVIDLDKSCYNAIENGFFQGYSSETKHGFPYLSIILRNILAVGFASNKTSMLENMFINSVKKCTLMD
jgi:tRNA A-37 threonylcarbamoyl transferase component Bud32